MTLWLERLNELDHYLALRHEAEQYRMVLHGQANQEWPHMVRSSALFWLGACLSSWGEYLQKRYGNDVCQDEMKWREA